MLKIHENKVEISTFCTLLLAPLRSSLESALKAIKLDLFFHVGTGFSVNKVNNISFGERLPSPAVRELDTREMKMQICV